jgi:peptidyl-prolyl cis-trans isomerase A (cyclophilin A)
MALISLLTAFSSCALFSAVAVAQQKETKKPVVVIETSMGDIEILLEPEKAPITVANFLAYVQDGFYDSTIFHRVIPKFMIQGGGMTIELSQKATKAPIKNEAANGLKNYRGTIAMARTNVINSATSQFFINVVDNDFLDHKDNSAEGFGYAVFGKVIKGMDVADQIAAVKRGAGDVPVTPIMIEKVTVKE